MKTKPKFPVRPPDERGSALFLTLVMTGIALATVAGVLSYSASNARLSYRSNQYRRAVSAAEGATEKVMGLISRDFLTGGENLVVANLSTYRQTTLTASDSASWGGWEFNDAGGNAGRTHVQPGVSSNYLELHSAFAGLRGYVTEYTVISNARQTPAPQEVIGGVLQRAQLTRIPIFQFALYSTEDMEISCGQPFVVTGRVHSNARLYVEPDNLMTFQSRVTAAGEILFQRHTNDWRTPPSGSVVYEAQKESPVPAMSLPIGTNNTPTAVREIIQPPPAFENPNSPMGRQRLYNQADMILVVTDSGMSASSGAFNSFATVIPPGDLPLFASTTNSFWDQRESKTVKPIDLNIRAFTAWTATNSSVRIALGSKVLRSLYIWDRRSLPGNKLGAVRLSQGEQLPARGLTVVTPHPLYVFGHYNQTNTANLATTNTLTTRPASLMADAVTILSPNWSDAVSFTSTGDVSLRAATPTTVNAAILAGAVESAGGLYGGGMENFPRFLESWGLANALTYNGSMVKMFPSLHATNMWGLSNVYRPPKRDWAYDLNFDNPALLPPLTPSLQWVVRSQWATIAPNHTIAPAR